ncbi:MAG: hypothetical protein EXR47_02945 [Dehalococcoidia bacterium]|nr:hypothetical protein [Dehalococcoidia bacterium]
MTTTEPRRRLSTLCECQDPSHQMEFILDEWDDDDAELYISVQLNQLHGFPKRCWLALRYIFGARSRYSYGHWDEGSISLESARELQPMLAEFIALREQEDQRLEEARKNAREANGG